MKVCILSAGVGSRIGNFTNMANKALLPINNRPVLSYIIDRFDRNNTEFVIAIGHEKNTIKDFLSVAYDNLNYKLVEIDNITGIGAGPGYSLLKCEKYLDEPFILTTSDTITFDKVPSLENNWVGTSKVKDTRDYCSFRVKNNCVVGIDDKVSTTNEHAWIGLAGIKNTKKFFSSLRVNSKYIKGETQISNGLEGLIENDLKVIKLNWFDTGSIKNYNKTKEYLEPESSFDFSKDDELLYFIDDRVVKFFRDKNIVENRIYRNNKLKKVVPQLFKSKGNFYSYKKIPGDTFYNYYSNQLFEDLLKFCEKNLFVEIEAVNSKKFEEACYNFYIKKTENRVNQFFKKSKLVDSESIINSKPIPAFSTLFKKINLEEMISGIQSNFHGDLQFDNIIYSLKNNSFSLIDWRDSFGGLNNVGDIYYDLSKMYAGINIPYNLIKKNKFNFTLNDKEIIYSFTLPNNLLEAKKIFESYVVRNGYSMNKIETLCALIFINMSGLHKDPLDHLLFFHGKFLLNNALKKQSLI